MLANVAQRIFPTLTEPLRSREDMRRLLDDDAAWNALFEEPLSELLERTFDSDLARGTVLTDALIGTFAPADDPLLRQNRCFLYHVVGGSWNVPVGGMGALSAALAGAARAAGAQLVTGAEVTAIETDDQTAEVTCADGKRLRRPARARRRRPRRAERTARRTPAGRPPEGAQLKINMLLARLPRVPGVERRRGIHGDVPRQRGLRAARPRVPGGERRVHPEACRRARSTATR